MRTQWNDKVFKIRPDTMDDEFNNLTLDIFNFQYWNNSIYKTYVDTLRVNPSEVSKLTEIPFLPIEFFRICDVKTTAFEPQAVFESSGTTQAVPSRHLVKDIEIYIASFTRTFNQFYGPINEWCILALLPSYLERENSSLVFMVNELIRQTNHTRSGFYLNDHDKLYATLTELEEAAQKTLLIGVSFGLIDFAEQYSLPLRSTTVLETGGMKGRRKEIIRAELHSILKAKFGSKVIHSEYGMTELLSQAYSTGDGIFRCPPWMKVLLRDEEDPLHVLSHESLHKNNQFTNGGDEWQSQRGVINVIDLANIYSCSFIATDDAGVLYSDGTFEVIGRTDYSDIRGCSLLAM